MGNPAINGTAAVSALVLTSGLAYRFTVRYGSMLTLLLIVLWPALALPAGVFSKGYFTFWTVIAIIWGLLASIAMIFLPIWESKDAIIKTAKNVLTWNPVPHETATTTYELSLIHI